MNILFVSDMLIGANVARLLKHEEGHSVRLHIVRKEYKGCFTNLVDKTKGSLDDALSWAGKEGLIVFDDHGHGALQDSLRARGYRVIGGGALMDRLEIDRAYGNQVFQDHGLSCVPLHTFYSYEDAIEHIKLHPAKWVVKFNTSHLKKSLSFIGNSDVGADTADVLIALSKSKYDIGSGVTLQERIDGIELSIARFFNGVDWVGPIEYSVEYTRLFPGNIGPIADGMGSLMWLTNEERTPLWRDGLSRFKPYLAVAGFRGDFAINFIVKKNSFHPIDVTPRFGCPEINLQTHLLRTSWYDIFNALAEGTPLTVAFSEEFGSLVTMVTPPFPFVAPSVGSMVVGLPVSLARLSFEERRSVHFEEISSHDGTPDTLYVAGKTGNVLYVTNSAPTMRESVRGVYDMVNRITIPRAYWREDIGRKFIEEDYDTLRSWGYF